MLNLNPARGTLTSLQLLCALTALWLGTRPALSNRATPGAYDAAPYLGEVRNQYLRRHLGAPRAVCQGPQHDYRSRQSGAVCHQ